MVTTGDTSRSLNAVPKVIAYHTINLPVIVDNLALPYSDCKGGDFFSRPTLTILLIVGLLLCEVVKI